MSLHVRVIGFGGSLAVVLLAAAATLAQNSPQSGGSRGRSFFSGYALIGLFRSERLQKDLKLTDEQLARLEEMYERLDHRRQEVRQRFGGLDDLAPEERRKKFDELRQQMQQEGEKRLQEARQEISGILTPDQVKRLHQIELQQEGPASLLRPEVAEAVGLTDEQKVQLEQIEKQTQEKLQNLMQETRNSDQQTRSQRVEQLRDKARNIRDEGDNSAMALLNPEQKKKLAEVMGEPFEMERPSALPRRGGGWGLRSRNSASDNTK